MWWDPKMRTSYAAGADGISCGILVVNDDSIAFASSRGIEFMLPRNGLQAKWRLTMGCVLMQGGYQYLVYLHPPVSRCPTVSQQEADRISAAHLGMMRTIIVNKDDKKAEIIVSTIGVLMGGRKGGDLGLLVSAFKTRHDRKALKARLG